MANSKYYTTNHRKKESEVASDDFYSTHPNSINTFLDNANFDIIHTLNTWHIWECAAGSGNISKELLKRKHPTTGENWKVISTDIESRGFSKGNIDFLKQTKVPTEYDSALDMECMCNSIITNPPYKYAEEFIRHAHTFNVELIVMYLKLTFLEGKKRYLLFKDFPLNSLYIHSSRQACDPEGRPDFPNSGATAYAWYVWKPKSSNKETKLYWLPPN